MRRALRISAWAAVGILVICAVLAGLVVSAVRSPLPQTEGTVEVPGLTAAVTVSRDTLGVPHIRASTAADLAFAQGYVHAQDRFYEMDVRRHITAGRLAEMFGASQVPTDAFIRTLGWRRVAEQEWPLLDPQTQAMFTAYAAGVNAYLAAHPGARASVAYRILGLTNRSYRIEPWGPIDSLAWIKAMAWDLRANMVDEIDRSVIAAEVGVVRTLELYPAYPYQRHRTVVTEGTAVDGVYRQRARPTGPPVSAAVPSLPPGSSPALERAREGIGAVDGVLDAAGGGIGSNSWAVSPALSATGGALLANDPHLAPALPSVWYQNSLRCEPVGPDCPFDVSGFSFAGLPGVVIGRTPALAWGFTNLGADVSDLFLEQVSGGSYLVDGQPRPLRVLTETIEVAGGEPVSLTIRATEHGPLVSDVSEEWAEVGAVAPVAPGAPARGQGYAVALAWTALTPGRTADAILALNSATSPRDVERAAALFTVPAQNIVYATSDGTIGYQTPGLLPIRRGWDGTWPVAGFDSQYAWTGTIPAAALPRVVNPAEGFIVTANQAVTRPRYPYPMGVDFAYGARAQRIADLLTTRGADGPLDGEDMRAIQLDAHSGLADLLIPAMTATVDPAALDPAAREPFTGLRGWSRQMAATSAEAAYFAAVWRALLAGTFDDELPQGYLADGDERWWEVVRHLWRQPNNAWWDDRTTPVVEDRDAIVLAALNAAAAELSARQGPDWRAWQWGELHTLELRNSTLGESGIAPIEALFNRGPFATAGGSGIVNATGFDFAQTAAPYEVSWLPSMRMVVDLANPDRSTWINLTGASGHPFSPHYTDQTPLWVGGAQVLWPFTPQAVAEATTAVLTLQPSGEPAR